MASELIIKIGASAKEFNDELSKVQKKVSDLDDNLSSVAKVSGVAFGSLVGTIGLTTKAFALEEESLNRVNTSLQNQGIYTADLAKKYRAFGEAIETKTGIDADQISTGQAVLQGFLGQIEITEDLTKAIVDLSVAQKIDLESAFQVVGKSIGSNTNALGRYGIEVSSTASKQEKMAQIIAGVNKQSQGQAETLAQGLGVFRLVSAEVGNLSKEFGKRFAPIVEEVGKNFLVFIRTLKDNKPLLDFLAKAALGATVLSGLALGLATAGIAIVKVTALITAASAAVGAFGTAVAVLAGATGIGLLVVALGGLALWLAKTNSQLDLKGKTTDDLKEKLKGLQEEETKLANMKAGPFYDGSREAQKTASLKRVRDQIQQVREALGELGDTQAKIDLIQDPKKKAEAEKRFKEEENRRQRSIASERAAQEVLLLEQSGASKRLVDLKKKEAELLKQIADDKNKKIKDQLQNDLAVNITLQEDAFKEDGKQRQTFNEEILKNNKSFQSLNSKQQAVFLEQNKQGLLTTVETEQSVRDSAIKESIQKDIDFNNRMLKNREKFGKLLGSVVTVINFQAVLEFAQTGLSALNQIAEFPNTIKSAADEAITKEEQLSEERVKDAEALFDSRKKELELSLERGQIDQAQYNERLGYIEEDRKESLRSAKEKLDANKGLLAAESAEKEKQLKAQQAAAGVLAFGLGKIADSFLPGIGTFVGEIVTLASKGKEEVAAAFSAFTTGFQTILITVMESIGTVLEGIGLLLGPLLVAVFEQLGPFLQNVLTSLGAALGDIIVGLLDAALTLFSQLDVIAEKIQIGLLEGIDKLIARAPEIVNKLVELMPLVSTQLATLMPTVAIQYTKSLIENADEILIALGRAAIEGQVNGNIAGFEQIINGFIRVINKVIPGDGISPIALPRIKLADGGIVQGGIRGKDSVPALVQPGELVVPTSHVPSVLNAVYSQLESLQQGGRGGSQDVRVIIGFDSREAERVLTARQAEARSLGIFRE